MFIYPYNSASRSAKALAEALGAKRIKRENSKFKGNENKKVINWGCSVLPEEVRKCYTINCETNVHIAADKLLTLEKLKDKVSIPPFSTDPAFVKEALAEGVCLFARKVLNGHSGQGIVIMEKPEDFVEAPLYTMYKKKTQEYRIHVGRTLADNFKVISEQRKARSKDIPDDKINWKVRNLAGGFIYARNENIAVPQVVKNQAMLALSELGLDFGAVDVIYHEPSGECFVLEVNTAPGLTGSTLTDYANFFREFYE